MPLMTKVFLHCAVQVGFRRDSGDARGRIATAKGPQAVLSGYLVLPSPLSRLTLLTLTK